MVMVMEWCQQRLFLKNLNTENYGIKSLGAGPVGWLEKKVLSCLRGGPKRGKEVGVQPEGGLDLTGSRKKAQKSPHPAEWQLFIQDLHVIPPKN